MTTRVIVALTGALLVLGTAAAGEKVGVDGSSAQYDSRIEATVGDKPVTMALTGTALRKRVIIKVYSIGSYIQEGASARSAEELAAADVPKQLHLIMERDVDGKEMAEAFETAIRANHPAPAFNAELASLLETMRSLAVKKGDHVRLIHVPRTGLVCDVEGKKKFSIPNVDFARAVWEIYLGRKNLGEDIKKKLVSRL